MKKIYFTTFLCSLSIILYAQVLMNETFDFTSFTTSDWTTTGTVTTPNTGRTVSTNPTLTYSTGSDSYIFSGVGKTLTNDYKSETTNYLSSRSFSIVAINNESTPNKVYVSFLYKVMAQGGTASEILGVTDILNNTSGIKVWYGKGATSSSFKLGITRNSNSSSATQWFAPTTALDATVTYLIVVKYDYTTNVASLFVNPTIKSTEPSPSIYDDGTLNAGLTPKSALKFLVLRGNGANAAYFYMSGLRATQTWSEAVADKSTATFNKYLESENFSPSNTIKVYGNTIATSSVGDIEVYNLQGARICQIKNTNCLKSDLANGFYIVKFTDVLGDNYIKKITIR